MVKVVSSCYHEAVQAVIDGTYTTERISEWKKRLSMVFNRGFWDGYYLGQKLGEWNTPMARAHKRKVYLGKITNYFTKLNVAEIKLENGDLNRGDTILIIGPTTGAIEYCVERLGWSLRNRKGGRGDLCSVKVSDYLRRSDKLYNGRGRNPWKTVKKLITIYILSAASKHLPGIESILSVIGFNINIFPIVYGLFQTYMRLSNISV